MIDFSIFEKISGVYFKNKDLLQEAFVHRSYINENPRLGLSHNERLEFLGDAVLELAVTDHLFRTYPLEDEGALTAYRAALVNANTIATVAERLTMNDYLLLSRGEAKDMGKARQYILANTFEAFVGAVYMDQGYDAAEKFIRASLFGLLHDIIEQKLWRDAKSLVQERAQEHLSVTPSYRVVTEAGPDHDKQFTVGIYFGQDLIAKGNGKSKQEAEQSAALAALEKKKWND